MNMFLKRVISSSGKIYIHTPRIAEELNSHNDTDNFIFLFNRVRHSDDVFFRLH